MFRIEYELFSTMLISDVQVVEVDTLEDAELVAVLGFGQRLGVDHVFMRHIADLVYEVFLGSEVVGRFKITIVSSLTETTPQSIF